MGFTESVIPILNNVSKILKEGMKVAKAVASICALGILTIAAFIGQLTDLEEEPDGEQPP